jgi:hypothetical protein
MWYEDPHKITWEQVGKARDFLALRDFFLLHFPKRDFAPDFAEVALRLKREFKSEDLTPFETFTAGALLQVMPGRRT